MGPQRQHFCRKWTNNGGVLLVYHTKSARLFELQVNSDGHTKHNTKIQNDYTYINMGLKYPEYILPCFPQHFKKNARK